MNIIEDIFYIIHNQPLLSSSPPLLSSYPLHLLAILMSSLVLVSLASLVTILLASGEPEITMAGLTWDIYI